MRKLLSLLIYNALLPAGFLAMLPAALRKMKARGGTWRDLAQRLGHFNSAQIQNLASLPNRRWWFHAVSVGEVGIALKCIQLLHEQEPALGITLTTTTPTAYQMALDWQRTRPALPLCILYSPVDFPWVGHAFLRHIRPEQLILVEAELWPNLVSLAQRKRIPVSMINARLSQRSEKRYLLARFFIQPLFAILHRVYVQEAADIARFTRLGIPSTRIRHTGSIKFDPAGAAPALEQVSALRQILQQTGLSPETHTLILLASTHPGEETLLTRALMALVEKVPNLALLITPRHVERAESIEKELGELGLQPVRRRQPGPCKGPFPTLLIDSTGELRAWQQLASVVIIGKSFLATGGQNPAEAILCEKLVCFGPHMENFQALADNLLAHRGAIQVSDAEALQKKLLELLTGPPEILESICSAGYQTLQQHAGATQNTLAALLEPTL
jgi:3-deoxy-D-manno-octulosonic-acid transferase